MHWARDVTWTGSNSEKYREVSFEVEANLSNNDEDIIRSKSPSHAIFRSQAGADTQDCSEKQEPHYDQADPALVSGHPRPGLHDHDTDLACGS